MRKATLHLAGWQLVVLHEMLTLATGQEPNGQLRSMLNAPLEIWRPTVLSARTDPFQNYTVEVLKPLWDLIKNHFAALDMGGTEQPRSVLYRTFQINIFVEIERQLALPEQPGTPPGQAVAPTEGTPG